MTVKKTILCVDDEHSLSIHKVTLETRGYRVLACSSAAETMNILAQSAVDLVLSNVELADSPSEEWVSRLPTLSAETPVLWLCGNRRPLRTDLPPEIVLRKGAYVPADLLERIRHMLMKRRGPRRTAETPTWERARAS
jgi:two-component system, OmpR family, response regulator CpxR